MVIFNSYLKLPEGIFLSCIELEGAIKGVCQGPREPIFPTNIPYLMLVINPFFPHDVPIILLLMLDSQDCLTRYYSSMKS